MVVAVSCETLLNQNNFTTCLADYGNLEVFGKALYQSLDKDTNPIMLLAKIKGWYRKLKRRWGLEPNTP